MPADERRNALEEALAAYDRGDYFEAHELLEPAWLGTPDTPERELYAGIIKLAAAYVHDARGNPGGVTKGLRGARERLIEGAPAGPTVGIDVASLVSDVETRLAVAVTDRLSPPTIRRLPR